jgi:DNA polymerase alpha subunit A
MINTRLNEETDLKKVKELGERVKKEVNRLYKTLELEIDGIFRSMLLLKKKKYAAKTVEELPNGEVKYGQELKGLDLVRRDWCVQSKDTGRYVTEQILSGQDSEVVIQSIFTHLEELATKMRNGELPLEKYVITKGLSKHPNEYPDAKSQPHVHVAKMMLQNNRPVNTGDHIPYVITAPLPQEGTDQPLAKTPSATERARHPEEIARSGGVLKPDIEWYLVQQILPPVARLCEPIEGASQQILAEKLGLDSTRYNHSARSSSEINDDDLINYTPASYLSDEERFKDVEKLKVYCSACKVSSEFPGVFYEHKDETSGATTLVTGLRCTNPACPKPMFWGQPNHMACFAQISNTASFWMRGLMTKYYEGLVRCDEPGCGLETRQLSVVGAVCLNRGCTGRMLPVDTERDVHTHLKYLDTLFDVNHASDKLEEKKVHGRKPELLKGISKQDRAAFAELHDFTSKQLEANAFNWITPSFWKGLFNVGVKQ